MILISKLRLLLISDVHGNVSAIKRLVAARYSERSKFDAIILSGDFPATVPFLLVTQYILFHGNLSRIGYSKQVYFDKLRAQFIRMQLHSIDQMIPELEKLSLPIYYTHGNIETREALFYIKSKYKEINYIDMIGKEFSNKAFFFGLGGSLDHLGVICDHEYTLEEFNKRANQLEEKLINYNSELPKIFIFHEPPKFTLHPLHVQEMKIKAKKRGFDYQFKSVAGSQTIYRLVKTYCPLLVINGHYHEYPGTRLIDQAHVVNPGALATYLYAVVNIDKLGISYKVKTNFYKILASPLSFINFLYTQRVFYPDEYQLHL